MVTGARWGAEVESAPVIVRGIDAPASVLVSGGRYAIDGGAFTAATGVIRNGQVLRVRAPASIEPGAVAEALVDVGGVTSTFRVQTRADALPANKRVGGANATHASLAAAANTLQPGDVLEISGGPHDAVLFDRAGTRDKPIVVRGVADAQGRRPLIQGVANNTTVLLAGADHMVLDNLEITNGPGASIAAAGSCVRNVAHEVTLRRVKVHGCKNHGVLGADDGGSLTLDRVEVTTSGCSANRGMNCQGTNEKHPVYVATHPRLHPNAVLRVQDSQFHGNASGETIKTRAQRVELRYNWIESSGKGYHRALGLYGYDGEQASLAEPIHHDVVGNVIVVRDQATSVARFGGDDTGDSYGCTRLVNNTVLVDEGVAGEALIQLDFILQGFAATNNLFSVVGSRAANAPVRALSTLVIEERRMQWADGGRPKLLLSNNHVPKGSLLLQTRDGDTFSGAQTPPPNSGRVLQAWSSADTPGLVSDTSFAALDVTLQASSPLRSAGTAQTRGGDCVLAAALPLPLRNAVRAPTRGPPEVGAARSDSASATPALGARDSLN
jgi:hypothetical protein